MTYRWDANVRRYRDERGRFLSRDSALTLHNQAIARAGDAVTTLAGLVSSGQISPADWRERMRQEIKIAYIQQYLAARGGATQMTQRDWGSIGGMIADQYRYLDGFVDAIAGADPPLSEGYIAARARMYANSAREASERAHARGRGLPNGSLPAWPGDGSTQCLSNCKCHWEIDEELDAEGNVIRFLAYWRLGAAEHCPDCTDRAAAWSPFVVDVSVGRSFDTVRRLFAPDHALTHPDGCTCRHCEEEHAAAAA